MTRTLKDEIIKQVNCLDASCQQQVLEFARRLTRASAVPGRDLLRFAGSVTPADLAEINRAILEGCETVEQNAW